MSYFWIDMIQLWLLLNGIVVVLLWRRANVRDRHRMGDHKRHAVPGPTGPSVARKDRSEAAAAGKVMDGQAGSNSMPKVPF